MFGHINSEKFCRIRIVTSDKREKTILEVPNDAPLYVTRTPAGERPRSIEEQVSARFVECTLGICVVRNNGGQPTS